MEPADPARRPSFPVSELDYNLPEALIAPEPTPRREQARLLVMDRPSGAIQDESIVRLPALLRSGDLVVLNNTKVLPAKFNARRESGSMHSGLFIEEVEPGLWRVMLTNAKRVRVGTPLDLPQRGGTATALRATAERRDENGNWLLRIRESGSPDELLPRVGTPPLPPYIERRRGERPIDDRDDERYQTVYATRPGAIAAPTAGLHLTDALLQQLRGAGVAITTVTLHVGVGTFQPIRVDDLADHKMHGERYEVSGSAADAIAECRKRGGRVVAVGTTSVRVLETAATGISGLVTEGTGISELFIYPPYSYKVVDALLTNFHLPRSTLLAMIMALAGTEFARHAYRHAIDNRYRFFSYGDAMLIL